MLYQVNYLVDKVKLLQLLIMDKEIIEKRAKELDSLIEGMRRKGFNFAKVEGLKNSERRFLWLLSTMSSENLIVKPSDIAKKIGITMAAVTHQINALKELGYVKLESGKEDRREVSIVITPTGKKQVTEIKKHYWKKLYTLVEFLGEDDSANLTRIIEKMSRFHSGGNYC